MTYLLFAGPIGLVTLLTAKTAGACKIAITGELKYFENLKFYYGFSTWSWDLLKG